MSPLYGTNKLSANVYLFNKCFGIYSANTRSKTERMFSAIVFIYLCLKVDGSFSFRLCCVCVFFCIYFSAISVFKLIYVDSVNVSDVWYSVYIFTNMFSKQKMLSFHFQPSPVHRSTCPFAIFPMLKLTITQSVSQSKKKCALHWNCYVQKYASVNL